MCDVNAYISVCVTRTETKRIDDTGKSVYPKLSSLFQSAHAKRKDVLIPI